MPAKLSREAVVVRDGTDDRSDDRNDDGAPLDGDVARVTPLSILVEAGIYYCGALLRETLICLCLCTRHYSVQDRN